MSKILELIARVKAERAWFKANRHHVDAAACAIREQALTEAYDIMQQENDDEGWNQRDPR
jgi:hypothetical protein